jgi:MtN3 and saliva related transmembrane protein
MVEMVGLTAGCMTTCSFIPQVVRTYRSRSVKDISLRMYLLMSAGVLLWVVYGAMIGSVSVMTANVVSFILTAAIVIMKIVFGRTERKKDTTHTR